MRELALHELAQVAGGGDLSCGPEDGNTYGGVSNTENFGDDIINMYEGLVSAASHIIERVANAL